MTRPLRVGVKYCGNCNPLIDGKNLLKEIKREASDSKLDIEFLSWHEQNFDVLLVISSCPVDCASRPEYISEELIIAGETINRHPCNEGLLSSEVVKVLERYLHRSF